MDTSTIGSVPEIVSVAEIIELSNVPIVEAVNVLAILPFKALPQAIVEKSELFTKNRKRKATADNVEGKSEYFGCELPASLENMPISKHQSKKMKIEPKDKSSASASASKYHEQSVPWQNTVVKDMKRNLDIENEKLDDVFDELELINEDLRKKSKEDEYIRQKMSKYGKMLTENRKEIIKIEKIKEKLKQKHEQQLFSIENIETAIEKIMLTLNPDTYESKEIVHHSTSKSYSMRDDYLESSEPSGFWSSVLKYDYMKEEFNSVQIKVSKFLQTYQVDISLVPENILQFAQIKDGTVTFNSTKFFCRTQLAYAISDFIDNFLNISHSIDQKYFKCVWTKCYNQETHLIIDFLCNIIFTNKKNYYTIYLLQYFIVALNNISLNKINGFFQGEFVDDEELKDYWIDKAKQIISILEKS